MTNRTRRPKRKTGKLKVLLLTSSFFATMAGTHLLNTQDALQAAAADNQRVTMVEVAANGTIFLLPPAERGEQIELKKIPQVLQPQIRPVARSRSSK